MENCQKETGLLPGDFPVSRTASPEKSKRQKTSAIFGLNVGGCYANYDPTSHCLKTSQGFLFPTEDGSLTESCLTFTKAGLMRNGKLYQLRKSARPMLEKEFGLSAPKSGVWRTPDANMERGSRSFENMQSRIKGKKPLNLNDQLNAIKKGLLPEPQTQIFPTPTAADATTGGIIGKNDEFYITGTGRPRRINKAGKDGSLGLARFVQFPTPQSRDYRFGQAERVDKQNQKNLNDYVQMWPTPRSSMPGSRPNGKGGRILAEEVKKANNGQEGQLNPEWVETLMGYPLFWTEAEKETVEINYPFAWLDGTWEKDIPRLTTKKLKRISRLKCLGNSVVPQIPALIWLMIKSYMEGNNG